MKNVRKEQLKKCIVKDFDEFKKDVTEILGDDVEIICDYDGIYFECDNEALYTEEILMGLSKHYGVDITSIHIDDCEYIGVWIIYK